jgi:hypothetical protein
MFKTHEAARAWNNRFSSTEAFLCKQNGGYHVSKILYGAYTAHRVAWAIHTGAWPIGEIDHIDGNPSNNRADNLREATRAQNMRNIKSRKGSTSKYLGVCYVRNKWRATITVNEKKIHLGCFSCEVEAAKKYDQVAWENFGRFARLNFPESKI